MVEQKTAKPTDFPLSASTKKALAAYLATRPGAQPTEPLFSSSKHGRPLQRGQARQIRRDAARGGGVTDPIVPTRSARRSATMPIKPASTCRPFSKF
ncbi:MAG: hypothetical protein OWU84_03800 [Firmicutes bacterium]|nr:hypothetical protein [Bacillota bacterium]